MCQIQSGRPNAPEPHQTWVVGLGWRIKWIQTEEYFTGGENEVERQQDQDSLHRVAVDYLK